jgi:hypothetical protein
MTSNLTKSHVLKRGNGLGKSDAHAIRSAAINLTFSQGPDLGNAPPRWKLKNLTVHLLRPVDSSVHGRSELKIWTPEQTVFQANWSPYDDSDLIVATFIRGPWEERLMER